MLKRDYFLRALKSEAGRKKHWMFSVFALTQGDPKEDYPYVIYRKEDGVYFKTESGLERIDDAPLDRPLFKFRERFDANPGDIPNLKEAQATTYGSMVCNYTILCLPFGDLIEFQPGYFDLKKVESYIKDHLVSDPDDGFAVPYDRSPDQVEGFMAPKPQIYVRQKAYFDANIQATAAYNPICVHSVTQKSLFPHPDADRVKKEYIEKNKDKLTDPAEVAKLEKILQDMDREWLKDDPSMDFYLKSKYFTTARKRQYYSFGAEAPFSDGSVTEYIDRPLNKGLDVSKLPTMINTIREGSHNRGAMTELGGAATKAVYRAMSTAEIGSDDCGDKIGMPVYLNSKDRSYWIGCYVLEQGNTVEITAENFAHYQNRVVRVRSPMSCKEAKPNFCKCCLGKPNTEIENGLAAAAGTVTGKLLYVFMAAFHAVELKTVQIAISDALS